MAKNVRVIIQDKNTIILCEDAKSGDIINLKEINQLDTSFIEQLIDSGKDQVYNRKLNEFQSVLEHEKEKEIQLVKAKTDALVKEKEYELDNKYQKELQNIQSKLNKENEELINQKQEEYYRLKNDYIQLQSQLEVRIKEKQLEIQQSMNKQILILENKIMLLKQENEATVNLEIAKVQQEKIQEISNLKEKYYQELSEKEETIHKLSRQKSSLNVKQTGEDLEIWCNNEVNEQMQNGFFNCTWNKDNRVIKDDDEKKGSKADYIFKIYASENHSDEELLTSICLEMKDENPDSINKQTNEHYYKALDKNRVKKDCKFALLVSNLENDKPNAIPIFKVREYQDMYVVRPAYLMTFLHMVTSLAMRYKELILKHSEEKLELKNQLEFIEEFNQIKKTYLETPLNNLQKQVDAILKANESITKANDSIKIACDEIIAKYINGIKDKIDRFDAKLNKSIQKIN